MLLVMNRRQPKVVAENPMEEGLEIEILEGEDCLLETDMIEPKVMESYTPIPNRVPRKVVINRIIKNNLALNIKEKVEELGIDLEKEFVQNNWIDLSIFFDETMSDYSPREWIYKSKNKKIKIIALDIEKSGVEWRPGGVLGYNEEQQLLVGKFDNGREFALPKLLVCIKSEN